MATKTKHDLLLEKIRRRYEETQTTNNKLNESLSTQVIQNQNTLPYNDDTWSWQKNYLNISRVANNFAEGFLGSFEGLLDLGTGIVGSGLEAIGLDDASKSVHDFGARNLSDELLKSDFNKYLAYGTAGWLSGVGIDEFHESTFGDQERLPSIVGDLATGAGNLVGMIVGSKGLGSIGKAGSVAQKVGQYGAIVGMSGGKSYEQALNEGASGYEATAYGVASGVTELASELVVGKLMSKIGLGTGKVLGAFGGEAPKAVNPNSSALGTAVKGIMKNFTEEGAEEVFSDLANPLLQKLTYKQEENIMKVYGDALGNTPEEVASSLAETFIVGGILGGVSSGVQTATGAKRLGSLEGYNLSQEVSALEEVNEDLKKAIASNNTKKIEALKAEKQSIQEALAIKYEKFLKDVESGRISKDELLKRIADDKLDNQLAVQLNRQGVADTYNEQVNRDLRKELSNEVAKLGFKGNIRVDIGEVQKKADGTYERLQGSYYDEKLKRVVLKSNQVKYNKLAEVLGHEFKHILESKELTELLLSDLSEADYKRMYKETYKAYSTLDEFNKLDEAKKEQYIREEMTADILGGYFSNLNQMARAFKKMDAKGIARLYYNVREMFDESPRKNKNYKKVMELIEKTRADVLEKYSKEQVANETKPQESNPRFKVDTENSDELDSAMEAYLKQLEADNEIIESTSFNEESSEKFKKNIEGLEVIELNQKSEKDLTRFFSKHKIKLKDIESFDSLNNHLITFYREAKTKYYDDYIAFANSLREYVNKNSKKVQLLTYDKGIGGIEIWFKNSSFCGKLFYIPKDFNINGVKLTFERLAISDAKKMSYAVEESYEIQTEKNKQQATNNLHNTSEWEVSERTRKILERIYDATETKGYKNGQFLNIEYRKVYEHFLIENEAYSIGTVCGRQVPIINKNYYTPLMQELEAENKKLGIDTYYFVDQLYEIKDKDFNHTCGGFTLNDEKVIFIKITSDDLIDVNRHEKMHRFFMSNHPSALKFKQHIDEYFKENPAVEKIVREWIDRYYHFDNYKTTDFQRYLYDNTNEILSYVYQKFLTFGKDIALQEQWIKEFDEAIDEEYGTKLRFKLNATQSETVTEEYALGTDEYGSKRLVESAENPRYSVDKIERVIPTLSKEYKTKGSILYEDKSIKKDDKTVKVSDLSIYEKLVKAYKSGSMQQLQLSSIAREYNKLKSYLEYLTTKTNATKDEIEKALNYAYVIENYLQENLDNFETLIRTNTNVKDFKADLASYFADDSKLITKYNKVINPKYKEPVVEQPKEPIEEQPKETSTEKPKQKETGTSKKKDGKKVDKNKEETAKKKTETKVKRTKKQIVEDVNNAFSEAFKHLEENSFSKDYAKLFTEKQYSKIETILKRLNSLSLRNGSLNYTFYGLKYFDAIVELTSDEITDERYDKILEELKDNEPSAERIYNTYDNIEKQIVELYAIIEENVSQWSESKDIKSIEKAKELISDLCDIIGFIDEIIGDTESNIFDNFDADDTYDFEYLYNKIQEFYVKKSPYSSLMDKLDGVIIAIENSKKQQELREATNYGGTQRRVDSDGREIESSQINSEIKWSGQSETQSVRNSENEQEGQELRSSGEGVAEESGNEPSGVHTDSETVVEETVETAEEQAEETTEPTETVETTEPQQEVKEPVQETKTVVETENSIETVAKNTKTNKSTSAQIVTVIIQNTRYKSPKDNAKTLRWGAELYNKKVYTKNGDAKPLLERISNYLHRQYKQNLIVKGKGNEMLQHQIIEVMDSIDKNFTVEQRINAVFELIKEYIPEYKKSIKTTVMKYIREQFEKGGKKSKMVKLVEATTEFARNRYAKELDEAYKSLQETLDMVDVYAKTVEELKAKIEGLDTQNAEHAKEAKELKKTINSLEKEIKKLEAKNDTQKQKLEELKKTVAPLKQEIAKKESEINSLKKKVKRTSTAKATVQSALSGQKVINSKFRKGLDAIKFDELVDDGFKVEAKEVDDSLYNKITFAVSNNNIDGAVEKYLNFVGEFVVTKPDGTKTKLNDGSPEWNEFAEQIKQFFQEFYYEAPTSPTQNLKDELAKQEALMKGVVSLIKSSYAIKRKLNKKMGVAQPLNKLAKFIVKGIGNPSITNLRNGQYREIIKEAYKQLTTKVDGENMMEKMGFIFDPAILDMMNQIGNNATGEMTSKEIEDMINIVKYISKFLTKSVGGRVHDGITDRERVIEAIKQQKKLGQNRKWYKFLNALSPRVVFEYMDAFQEGINTYIYNKMLEGEITEQGNYLKLNKILNDFYEETEAGKRIKKELGKKVTIHVNGYGDVTATTGQFMSIWKLLKRKDSRTHIANSGFSFTEKSLLKSEVKEYHFNKEQLDAFESAVKAHFQFDVESSPYEQYIKKLTKFFEEAKRMKIETDRLTKGFTNVIENEEYFPIKVVAHDRLLQLGENNDFMSLAMQGSRNYSFNASVEGLKGILEVSSVDSVVNVYSTQMARYSGYAETIDMVNTLFNYQLQDGDLSQGLYKGETLRNVMGKQYGYNKNTGQSNVLSYYNKLFKDVQGIRSNNDSWFEKLRKRFATFQLGANLKVMANQFSALPTALRYVSSKNLTLAWLNVGKVKVKDMPISAQYRMTKNQVVTAQTLTQQVEGAANFFGKGMEFTDNLVLKVIWSACLLETNNDVTKATKLFDDIHRETQGFNTLERSALLRSENSLIKSMMMFTIQPSHNLSNIAEMFLHMSASKQTGAKMSKADIKKYRNSVIGIAIEGAMYTAIGLLFKFLLGRDEDDEYEIESILESYINDNIIGMIPFLNSFGIDFEKGITMNDFNVGAISQLYEAFEEVQNIFDEDSNPQAKLKSLLYALGMVSGVPTRNMNNYGTMLLKLFCPDVAYDWEIKSSGASLYNKEAVNTALDQNKSKKAWNYYKAYTDNIVSVDEKTAKVMFDLYADGYRDAYIKQIPIFVEGIDENVVIDKEQFKKTYSEVSMALKKLTSSPYFTQLSDIKKEKLIKKVVNYYYEVAVKEQSGKPLKTMEILVKEGYCPTRTLIYLNEINDIRETRTMTRKEAVFKYINKLPISRAEKFLIYYLAGYTVPKDKQILVKNFLRSKGLSTKSLKELFE